METKFVRYWSEYNQASDITRWVVKTHETTAVYYEKWIAIQFAVICARKFKVVPEGPDTYFLQQGGPKTWAINVPRPPPNPLP